MRAFRYLLFLHFWNDGVRTSLVVMLPFMASELLLSYTTVGLLGGMQSFFAALLAIPAGYLAARLGRVRVLVSGLLLYSLGAIAVGFSTTAETLVPLFIFGSVGFGVFHIVAYAHVSHESPPERLGKNMGDLTSIGDVGRIAVSSAALFAVAYIGWRMTAIVLGLVGIGIYILIQMYHRRLVSQQPVEELQQESPLEWLKGMFVILKTKRLALTALAGFIDSIASNPLIVFIPFLLLARGVGPASLALFTGGYFVGNFLGKLVLGRAVDRYGNVTTFIAAEILMAITIVLFAVGTGWIFLLTTATLMGLFSKGTSPVMNTIWSKSGQKGSYEKVFAMSDIFGGVAATLAPLLLGIVADQWTVIYVFYICAGMAVVATIPLLFLPKE